MKTTAQRQRNRCTDPSRAKIARLPVNDGVQQRPRLRLVQARHERRLSQQELADRLGTSYVNISRWERGMTRPSPYFRSRLCSFFGKTEEELELFPRQQGEPLAPPFSGLKIMVIISVRRPIHPHFS